MKIGTWQRVVDRVGCQMVGTSKSIVLFKVRFPLTLAFHRTTKTTSVSGEMLHASMLLARIVQTRVPSSVQYETEVLEELSSWIV